MSTQTHKENPFLGLKPYEQEDRKKLYGRDRDLLLMKDRIFSGRTTLLFAGSGVGKTSFINAKIIPDLKRQYDIIYHNKWSIGDPLTALATSLAEQCPRQPNSERPSLLESPNASLLDHLQNYIKGGTGTDGDNKISKGRCLIILDQFEEIFQYHSHQEYFANFIDKLSELINLEECNARVLFSMREEFLGELSVFDNKIPDLFGNYYRLKNPTRQEAAEIIERTCGLVDVPVEEHKLQDFVRELTWIEPDAVFTGNDSRPNVQPVDKDIVAPPYLQVACRGLWNAQFNGAKIPRETAPRAEEVSGRPDDSPAIRTLEENGNAATSAARDDSIALPLEQPLDQVSATNGDSTNPFLVHYQVGDARKMLQRFCQKTFASFSRSELSILITAFDFLVTKRGAKIAWELSSLAEHMNVKEDVLKSVLLKLSRPEARILRARGPEKALWFELYHDMYGPIVDEWRKDYRFKRQARIRHAVKTSAVLLGIFAFIAVAILAFDHWWIKPGRYEQLLMDARLEDSISYRNAQWAFTELSRTWGYGEKAHRLWAEAWIKRAKLAEKQEKSDEAFLSWLKAVADGPSNPDTTALAQVDSFLNIENYKYLFATFRNDPDPTFSNVPVFSADGSKLLSMTSDMRVTRWDLKTREKQTSNILQTDDTTGPPPVGIPGKSVGGPPDSAVKASGAPDSTAKSSGPPPDSGGRPGGPPGSTGKPSPPTYQPTQLTSAAGNLVAGIYGGKFYVWNFDGTKLWSSATGTHKSAQDRAKRLIDYGTSDSGQRGNSILFTPDGLHFVTLEEQFLDTYSFTDGKTAVHTAQLTSVAKMALSPDNHRLLVILKNGTLLFKDLIDTAKSHVIANKGITDAIFSPDGSRFLTRAKDSKDAFLQTAKIWDSSGKLIGDISQYVSSYRAVSFCDDNRTVAISTALFVGDRQAILRITLVDSDTNKVVSSRIISVDNFAKQNFNPDATSLLTYGNDGIARLWSLKSSASDERLITDTANRFGFATDRSAQTVAAVGGDDIAKYWNGDNATLIGEQKLSANKTVPSSQNFVSDSTGVHAYYRMILSPHGKYSAIKKSNQFILWDIANNREIPLDRSGKRADDEIIAFSSNDDMLAIVDTANKISLWRNLHEARPAEVPQLGNVRSVMFSPDNTYLGVVSYESTAETPDSYNSSRYGSLRSIKIFEIATLKEMKSPTDKFIQDSLRFGPNGKIIGRPTNDNSVIVFDISTGERQLFQLPFPIVDLQLTPDGSGLLATASDGTLSLMDTNTGKSIAQQKYDFRVRTVRISADGATALVFSDNWIHVFDLKKDGFEYVDGQLMNMYPFPIQRDASGRNLRRVWTVSDKTFAIQDFSLASGRKPATPPTVNDVAAWQTRLGLKFDSDGQLGRNDGSRPTDVGAPGP